MPRGHKPASLETTIDTAQQRANATQRTGVELPALARRSSFRPVLNSDSNQRMVLGWQIRWIASLFCLLIVAAGAIPACASDGGDSLLDVKTGALHSGSHSGRQSGHDLGPATSEFLGSSSAWEPDLEDDSTDLTAETVSLALFTVRESRQISRHEEQILLPAFEPGLLSPRAPPRI